MKYSTFVERVVTGVVNKNSLNDFEGWEQAFALPAQEASEDDDHVLYGSWKDSNGAYEPDQEGDFAAISHSDTDDIYIVWSRYVVSCTIDEYTGLGDLNTPGEIVWAYTLPRNMMYHSWNEANPFRVLRTEIIEEFCLYSSNKLYNSYRHTLWDLLSIASEPELRRIFLAYPDEVETYLNLHAVHHSIGEILGDVKRDWRLES